MRVVLDPDVYEGDALCVGLAPAAFDLDEDDYLTILEDEPDPAKWPDVEVAVRACSKQALRIGPPAPPARQRHPSPASA